MYSMRSTIQTKREKSLVIKIMPYNVSMGGGEYSVQRREGGEPPFSMGNPKFYNVHASVQ